MPMVGPIWPNGNARHECASLEDIAILPIDIDLPGLFLFSGIVRTCTPSRRKMDSCQDSEIFFHREPFYTRRLGQILLG